MKTNSCFSRELASVLIFIFSALCGTIAFGQSADDIYRRLQKLEVTTNVLYVAAHPDDENTRLITWMSREMGFRTAYVSLTRGEGGQNLIGPELGPELGLIRTQELIAARKIDGGEQFFTRAADFGYSKTSEETLNKWNKKEVLDDLVSIIRMIRPDVIICRFPPDTRAGHGHHASSAILAKEAFECASDSTCFPPSAVKYGVWKPRALYWNTYRFGSNNTIKDDQPHVEAGGFDPVAGFSNGEIAARSRSQHKSQGFGVALQRGTLTEYFSPVAGDTTHPTPFDGLPIKWSTLKDGNKILSTIQACMNRFDFRDPARTIPQLLELRHLLLDVENIPWIPSKLAEVENLIADCAGLWLSAYSYSDRVAVSDTLHIQLQAILRNHPGALIDIQPERPGDSVQTLELKKQIVSSAALIRTAPSSITQPSWLDNPPPNGNSVESAILPWPTPAIEIPVVLKINNQRILYRIPVEHKSTDPVKGELVNPLIVTPRFTGQLSAGLSVFPSVGERKFKLKLTHHGNTPESIRLRIKEMPDSSWSVSFRDTVIQFTERGEEKEMLFSTGPHRLGDHSFDIGFNYSLTADPTAAYELLSIRELTYDHIPKITTFPKTELQCRSVRIAGTGSKRILFIKGAGDGIPPILRQLGWSVTEVSSNELDTLNLNTYDAVLTGIRAFNTDKGLASMHKKLMTYVQNGGHMVVQYNTNSNLHPGKIMAPFPFTITRNRTTEEDAEIKFTDPEHPIFNKPNRITKDDFRNWVQERGLYYAGSLDSAYTDLLLMNDKGEDPIGGSLIQCEYGKGRFIYTGLAFFRQLPAGNPGALRLFVNLLSE